MERHTEIVRQWRLLLALEGRARGLTLSEAQQEAGDGVSERTIRRDFEALTQAVHDNLRNLGRDVLDVVNLRVMFDAHGPAEGSIEAPLTAVADLQRQGLVRHVGLINVTATQVAEGRRI